MEEIDLEVVTIHDHFIHSLVRMNSDLFHFVVNDLEAELKEISEPLFVGGDFNCIITLEERQGGANVYSQDLGRFGDCVNEPQLIDMSFSSNSLRDVGFQRIIRVFVKFPGRLRWDEGAMRHLLAIGLDYNPLFLSLENCGSTDESLLDPSP
ncbi:LOW QUALITY PROTEIN: hypothetical protein V2J09_017177 [Rumex salicifolius]